MPSVFATEDNENFDESSSISPLNQIIWQGLPGVYLAAANGGLMKSVNRGITWAYLRPSAEFGSAWPAGAIGRQASFAVGPRVCLDDPIWEEIQQNNEDTAPSGPDAPIYWVGVTDSPPGPPYDADKEFTLLGTYEEVTGFTGFGTATKSWYLVTVTGENPWTPFMNCAWLKCSERIDKVNIEAKLENDFIVVPYPAIGAGGPGGAHYNGHYNLSVKIYPEAADEKDVVLLVSDIHEGFQIFGQPTGGYVEYNANRVQEVFPEVVCDALPDDASIWGLVCAIIGPVVDPAIIYWVYDRYWDEAGVPATAAGAFLASLRLRLSRKVADQ